MSDTKEHELGPAVAVIGMAGRFPGARDVNEFWELLRNGREAISRFQPAELKEDSALASQPQYVPAKAILEDIEFFDAGFFGFNRREAEILNPQHRLFLECCWEALENAGYAPDRTELSIGVFAGASLNHYGESVTSRNPLSESLDGFQTTILNQRDHLPASVSYKLNLRGPSLNVQTACSTSLVAIHIACQSLLGWECDMALAGGVSVRLPQEQGYLYQPGGIESPDGHCRPFDARAEGTVGGNGAGVVLLKRLEDAMRDGDTVVAVIRGSAINNDGHNKAGYTAPSVTGQAEAIELAHRVAGVKPETITYIEAHGTGTPVGDPIEITALTQAFRNAPNSCCGIGSVKSNIGHLDAAAGVAGFIKTALALQQKQLPPTLHFSRPNPRIDFAASPFYVVDRLSDWKSNGPRRAGVSSFGIGGTNAHAVLQEAPDVKVDSSAKPAHLLILSARSKPALRASMGRLARYLRSDAGSTEIADIAYTLQIGRSQFPHRCTVVCSDARTAVSQLENAAPARDFRAATDKRELSPAFLFPGQGSQYAGMAGQVYEFESLFREQFDVCAKLLKPELGLDLKQVLFRESWDTAELQETWLTQPALFAVEYALARLWMDWGVMPRAMLGHSIGEYVAACLAGVFSLETALKIVAFRGRLIASLPHGAMCLVTSTLPDLELLLQDDVSVATINGEALFVVAGSSGAISSFERRASEAGVIVHRLRTSHAFHSPMMEPILKQFGEFLSKQDLQTPRIPYISNLTGGWIESKQATDPQYWVRHLRNPVQFHEGMSGLLKSPHRVLVEVGPGTSLGRLAIQHREFTEKHSVVSSLGSAQDSSNEFVNLIKVAGELWALGVPIDCNKFYAGERRHRVPLPTYPFERKRYWIEPAELEAMPARRHVSLGGDGRPRFGSNPHAKAERGPQMLRTGSVHAVISSQLNIILQQLMVLKTKPQNRLRG